MRSAVRVRDLGLAARHSPLVVGMSSTTVAEPRLRRRPQNPFRVLLQHRNFRLYWLGQTGSQIGTWVQSVARGWLALQLSNSAFIVAFVGFAGSIPVLLFSL